MTTQPGLAMELVMRQAKTLNVSLTPELHAFVAAHVASGRFGTASEVVRAALRALEREEAEQAPSRLLRDQAGRP